MLEENYVKIIRKERMNLRRNYIKVNRKENKQFVKIVMMKWKQKDKNRQSKNK